MYERAYHQKAIKTDKKVVLREKKRKRTKRILYMLLGVLVTVSIIFLLRMPRLQVREVAVTGTEVLDPEDISRFALQRLAGNYLFIIPRTSIFLASPESLATALKTQFPRIKTIAVTRSTLHGLSVTIGEYTPTYLWCTSSDMCYVMDERGIVYSPAPYYSGISYPKIYKGDVAPLPFSPIDDVALTLVKTIDSKLRQINIIPVTFYFDSPRDIRVTFSHNTETPTIYFDPTIPILDALDRLYSGLRTDPLREKFSDPTLTLDYIDLRYDKKVVYKFR